MKKLLCPLLVAFSLTATAQKKVIESKTSFAKDVLQPYVESGELPGAISIFYNNGVQETCCVGYANVEQKRPIGLDNVYMQCSQTKGFCGVTIAKLVEEGKISLDDPVSKYLPEFKELWVQESDKDGVKVLRKAKNVLTVRMVLNHTGGFPFECSAKRADVRGGGWSGGAPLRQIASIAAGSPIMFEPGTRDLYSNTGIDIGAAVVEVVTGMKLSEYIKNHWDETIRVEREGNENLIGLPYPYFVSAIKGMFQEMYYWDVYFTNVGLIKSGRLAQAKNNVDNMCYLINKFGFMPNGNRTYYLSRSQPPFLSQMVRCIYEQTKDAKWLDECYKALEKEYEFWESERQTPCGLNRYYGKFSHDELMDFCNVLCKRFNMKKPDDEKGTDANDDSFHV